MTCTLHILAAHCISWHELHHLYAAASTNWSKECFAISLSFYQAQATFTHCPFPKESQHNAIYFIV
jgi:hypothetical protein